MGKNDYGPPPTIGHDKAHGCPGIFVFCRANFGRCPHSGPVSWATLGLPDEVAILDIPRYRGFVCTRCGVRNQVEVRADRPALGGGMGGAWGGSGPPLKAAPV